MNTLILVGAGLLLLYLYQNRTLSFTQPIRAPFARTSPSGTLVSVPGVGGFATGPGGTSIVLDPRLFGGITGTVSGAGTFQPGGGVTSPLLPPVGGSPGDAAGTAAGTVAGATQADGTTIGLPDPVIPPEFPAQIPIDPSLVDNTLMDTSAIVPAILPDPTLLDPGLVPQAVDQAFSTIF